jgi:hypothetical protein
MCNDLHIVTDKVHIKNEGIACELATAQVKRCCRG